MSEKDMSIDLVVYVQQKPGSVQHADCLRRLGDSTILAHTLHRLSRGLRDVGGRRIVLGHNDQFRDRVASQVEGSGFDHVLAQVSGDEKLGVADANVPSGFALIDDLRIFAHKNGLARHLLVFPENCIFPDCELTKALLECHLASQSDCTIAADYPFALVPIAFRVEALDRLPKFFLRAGDPDAIEALEFLFEQLRHMARTQLSSVAKDPFRLIVFPKEPVSSSVRAEMPLRMTVNDRFSLLAAEQVRSHPASGSYDSAAARKFKTELVSVYEKSRPSRYLASMSRRDKPARILFSSLRDAYSGPEQCLLSLMRGLDRSRFQPVLAVPRQCLLAQRASEMGIEVEISDFAFDRCQPASFAYWTRIIEDYDVRLVHLDLQVNAALIMAAFHRCIPVIGHVRTVVPQELPDAAYCVDRFIAISEFVAESLRKTYFNPARVSVIHDGVDTSRFVRERVHGFDGSRNLRVGMVARLNPGKRQDLLLKAMTLVKGSVSAFFYGEADPAAEEYSRLLVRLVHEHDLADKVTFCGFEPDINRIYEAFDVLAVCMPGEALGTCTLEALAAGLPVIAPDAGGSREIVRHEEQGLLYTAGDAASLAETLSRLTKNPALFEKLSRNARRHAESLSNEHHVEQVQDLYAELLGDHAEMNETLQFAPARRMAGLPS